MSAVEVRPFPRHAHCLRVLTPQLPPLPECRHNRHTFFLPYIPRGLMSV